MMRFSILLIGILAISSYGQAQSEEAANAGAAAAAREAYDKSASDYRAADEARSSLVGGLMDRSEGFTGVQSAFGEKAAQRLEASGAQNKELGDRIMQSIGAPPP